MNHKFEYQTYICIACGMTMEAAMRAGIECPGKAFDEPSRQGLIIIGQEVLSKGLPEKTVSMGVWNMNFGR